MTAHRFLAASDLSFLDDDDDENSQSTRSTKEEEEEEPPVESASNSPINFLGLKYLQKKFQREKSETDDGKEPNEEEKKCEDDTDPKEEESSSTPIFSIAGITNWFQGTSSDDKGKEDGTEESHDVEIEDKLKCDVLENEEIDIGNNNAKVDHGPLEQIDEEKKCDDDDESEVETYVPFSMPPDTQSKHINYVDKAENFDGDDEDIENDKDDELYVPFPSGGRRGRSLMMRSLTISFVSPQSSFTCSSNNSSFISMSFSDEDKQMSSRMLRNSLAAWQKIRRRRFKMLIRPARYVAVGFNFLFASEV